MTNYSELINKATQELKDNNDLFVKCVDELDSWNGYADGFRAYDMSELDDLHYGISLHDFLDRITSDFNIRDNYFYYSIYGLESCDYKDELYRDNVDEGELLDALIENYSNIDLEWIDSEFNELISEIVDIIAETEM